MSIEPRKRSNGKKVHVVRWRDGTTNRNRTFDRIADARAFQDEIRRLKQNGGMEQLRLGEQLLSEYTDQWWDRYAMHHLVERTRNVYSIQLDQRIIPHLGGIQLRHITPARVETFVHALRREGTGDPTILKTLTVLQSILRRATVDGAIQTNPVSPVAKPKQQRTRTPPLIRPIMVERLRLHFKAIGRDQDAMLIALLAYAGLRPESEGITLKWDQVRGRSLLITDTKRGRQRSVRLLEHLADDLDAWRRKVVGPLVVPNASGRPWKPHDWKNWQRRVFTPAAEAVGLPDGVRPRDLRGSFATLLIFEGRTIVEVAQQLGHSPEVSLRDYLQVIDEHDPTRAISVFEQIRGAYDQLTMCPSRTPGAPSTGSMIPTRKEEGQ